LKRRVCRENASVLALPCDRAGRCGPGARRGAASAVDGTAGASRRASPPPRRAGAAAPCSMRLRPFFTSPRPAWDPRRIVHRRGVGESSARRRAETGGRWLRRLRRRDREQGRQVSEEEANARQSREEGRLGGVPRGARGWRRRNQSVGPAPNGAGVFCSLDCYARSSADAEGFAELSTQEARAKQRVYCLRML
jgi:hypothetical protein